MSNDQCRCIGPYLTTRELGRGGMGVVYLARDSKLGRDVAIKALPKDFGKDAIRLERFEREARALASLNHTNVCAIYGFEEQDGQQFLILEYVEGETLEERFARGRLSVDEALDIAIQIAAGVAAAHDAGVIHRDLKPGNIVIGAGGRVKVLDFGLAKPVGDSAGTNGAGHDAVTRVTPNTILGTILGTPAYMSPEQACGRAVDVRTDLWSLGVILYECLTGTNPFASDSVHETLACVLRDDLDFGVLPVALPALARSVLDGCLQRDVNQRLQSAGDVRLLLEKAKRQGPGGGDVNAIAESGVVGTFVINDDLCRTLDRGGFDATLPGWGMQYADSQRSSDTIVLWIPSFGGDHTFPRYRELQRRASQRVILVTPVGMETGVTARPAVSIENQMRIVRAFATKIREQERPTRLAIAGFSCGGDFALRTASEGEKGLFDAVVSIDPNLEHSSCVLSSRFARIDPTNTDNVLEVLKEVGVMYTSLDDWVMIHDHLVSMIDKFESDIAPIVAQGKDISDPFMPGTQDDQSPFIDWYRQASDRVSAVRVLFAANEKNRRVWGAIRMRHLEDRCLGTAFNEDSIRFVRVSGHLEMGKVDQMLEAIDDAVGALC